MSIEDKFKAAVRVIHSLPQEGPYEPSNLTKLKFYGYYKQATEGKNKKSQPRFWDVIGRAKWEAWHRHGDMGKEEAMKQYLESFKEIMNTIPFTGNVEDFTESIGPFYAFVVLHGDEMSEIRRQIEEVTSKMGIALPDCERMPIKDEIKEAVEPEVEKLPELQEVVEMEKPPPIIEPSQPAPVNYQSAPMLKKRSRKMSNSSITSVTDSEVKQTVERLNRDVDHILARLRLLETMGANVSKGVTKKLKRNDKGQSSSGKLKGQALAFIVMWPILVHLLMKMVPWFWKRKKVLLKNNLQLTK